MRGTGFYKMTGSGNDFVVLDGRLTSPDRWPSSKVKAICDRRRGVGADGLVILTPATPDSVRMRYWNADGSPGELCGNAALCASRLAVQLEMVPPGEFCLLTDAGTVRVQSSAEDAAEIKVPDFDSPRPFSEVPLAAGEHWMSFVIVGVPHLVVRVDDVELVDPDTRGRHLRFHPSLDENGANVNFVSPAGAEGAWLIRTYERGVEAETLACGTGTVAAAAAVAYRGECSLPMTFRSRGGPELKVRARPAPGRVSGAWLSGQGLLLFRGVWEGTEAE